MAASNDDTATSLTRTFTVRQRRILAHRIDHELGPTEHFEIYKMLCRHNIVYTKNNNGIFVNLSTLDDKVVDNIQRFVEFYIDNKKKLDEYDKQLNECKLFNNGDVPPSQTHTTPSNGEPPDATSGMSGQSDDVTTTTNAATIAPNNVFRTFPTATNLAANNTTNTNSASMKFQMAKKRYAKRKVTDAATVYHQDLVAESYDRE